MIQLWTQNSLRYVNVLKHPFYHISLNSLKQAQPVGNTRTRGQVLLSLPSAASHTATYQCSNKHAAPARLRYAPRQIFAIFSSQICTNESMQIAAPDFYILEAKTICSYTPHQRCLTIYWVLNTPSMLVLGTVREVSCISSNPHSKFQSADEETETSEVRVTCPRPWSWDSNPVLPGSKEAPPCSPSSYSSCWSHSLQNQCISIRVESRANCWTRGQTAEKNITPQTEAQDPRVPSKEMQSPPWG